MHHLALAQEAYHFVYVGVVGKPQDIVIGRSRLLFCCHVLDNVRDGVGFYLKIRRCKRNSRRISRIHPIGMVNIIICLSVLIKASRTLAVSKLTNYAPDNFKVRKFLGANVCKKRFSHIIRHREPLRQIPQRS